MKNNREDRIKGILFGVAVGDALGAPCEFMSADEIKRKHGVVRDMIGGGWLNVHPGEVTDDTQMTLAVANGICENPDSPYEAIGRRFIQWYLSEPKDIGSTCSHSIHRAMHYGAAPSFFDWKIAALTVPGLGAGNGSLMRTAYPAMYYTNVETAIDIAGKISEMTHYDPKATIACQHYTRQLHDLIVENDKVKRKQYIIRRAKALVYDGKPGVDFVPKPTGYVVDSFNAAMDCLCTTETFAGAVIKAVNLGGDADTIAAITGGLAGAMYGIEAIPERWLNSLDSEIIKNINELNQKALANWYIDN